MASESGKSRALRIRLDYHRHRGRLYWSRWIAAALAVVLIGTYATIVTLSVRFAASDSPSPSSMSEWLSHVSTGDLSDAHQHFATDCHQCHDKSMLRPIGSDAFKLDPAASIAALAQACQKCHSVPAHFADMPNEACRQSDQNCARCHREHRGADFNIHAVSSGVCVDCHQELTSTCAYPSDMNQQVTQFTIESHQVDSSGSFRSTQNDTGRIRFDHAQHLQPGQVEPGMRGGFTAAMLGPKWQQSYRANEDGLVELSCQSCHELLSPSGVSVENPTASAPSIAARDMAHFYAPVDYEKHCVACHQSTFVGQTSDMLPLPHAAPRVEVQQLLAAKIQGGRVSGLLHENSTGDIDATEGVAKELSDLELADAVDRVFQQCSKCHFDEDTTDEAILDYVTGVAETEMLPSHWLQHGLFDHGAHDKITRCQFCHPIDTNQSASDGTTEIMGNLPPRDNEVVMIRGPESCVPCHRSTDSKPLLDLSTEASRRSLLGQGRQPDWAPADCTTCHRYHWSREAMVPPLPSETTYLHQGDLTEELAP